MAHERLDQAPRDLGAEQGVAAGDAARRQADALESAATRTDVTVAEMVDVVELVEMRQALGELVRQGLAKAPAHQ